jgi:phosphate transport system substrate-binding protein
MKKLSRLIAVSAIALTLLAGCGANPATPSAGNSQPSGGAGEAQSANLPAGTDTKISGTISTNGSTSMEKVIASLIEAFTAKHPDVTITYDATGSGAGITAATEGTADIGLSSRKLKDTETGLDATTIALDGIAIIVNNANAVENLTIEQISGLFTGAVTNWKEVGGADQPVSVIGREAGSGTRDGFESIVGVAEKCVYDQELTSTGAVITAVSSNEYAIGYASLSSVSSSVKSVTVESIECSEDTILNGTYAIQRPFVMVTLSSRELPTEVKAFIEYALSGEATEIIANAGAVQAQ